MTKRTYTRPKLKDVCDTVQAFFTTAPHCSYCFLLLTESGGFQLLRYYEQGSVEVVNAGNLRKVVRKALDLAENNLHERRRETSSIRKESTEEE